MANYKSRSYAPGSIEPFKLSRSKIDLFLNCPLCFYLDRRCGICQPGGFPFTLNNAVDHLLKKEFDIHRAKAEPHPLMKHYQIDAVPFDHPRLDDWRNNFHGVQYLHPESNFLVFGAVDDIWVSPKGELMVVDYKATSKDEEVSLDAGWQIAYKRQMEIYQWLLRNNGFKVSATGYFVYVNGRKDAAAFDGKLEFDVKVIPYTGNGNWIKEALLSAKACLENEKPPAAAEGCDFCRYRREAAAKVK